uniref:G-protein coupled receptors family 1 profile domain-containing protein n=1 Tax=Scophthalmus maximus TaxID=52904 RepID=A0A8D2ZUE5_SCOMX
MMQLTLSTLLHIISYTLRTINVPFCLILLIVAITNTLNTPLNLAGMAVECYIAICIPLRHGQICTVRNTYVLIGLIWAAGAISILPDLFIHLVINDMMQLTLSTLLHIISYTLRTINVPFCLILLIVAIITTLNTPLNLAGMAVECYIAICIPLRHGQICTVRNTYVLIGLIWAAGAVSILPDLFILLVTEPLQFFHSESLCSRDKVFRSTYSMKKRDASHIVCLVLVWLTLFYAYFRILFAAKGATVNFEKARNTILLHGFQLLLCMLVYVGPMFKQGLLYLLPQQEQAIDFAIYVFIQILPRFVSPVVYGLRDQMFRRHVRRYLLCKVSTSNQRMRPQCQT